MSTPFTEDTGPQPPKVLKTAAEIFANLRHLQDHHDPLIISFPERSQRFQSYLVAINRERGLLALDELIPNDGERFLKNGETFNVEGFHDGVRIAWESNGLPTLDETDPDRSGEVLSARLAARRAAQRWSGKKPQVRVVMPGAAA